jgi:hypothetical protein
MYCPSCKSEFREGFTRCGSCEVDLVHEIPPEESPASAPKNVAPGLLLDYCGFLSLEDAREARDRLRRERLPSEIVIRDLAGEDPAAPAKEEYWIRVPSKGFRAVDAILGEGATEGDGSEPGESVACSECGQAVGTEESFCPHCGAKFD